MLESKIHLRNRKIRIEKKITKKDSPKNSSTTKLLPIGEQESDEEDEKQIIDQRESSDSISQMFEIS